jgi:hypothetical protein
MCLARLMCQCWQVLMLRQGQKAVHMSLQAAGKTAWGMVATSQGLKAAVAVAAAVALVAAK